MMKTVTHISTDDEQWLVTSRVLYLISHSRADLYYRKSAQLTSDTVLSGLQSELTYCRQ